MPAESATPTRATAAWRALMGPVSPAQGGATVAIAAAAAVGIGACTGRRVGWRTGLLTAVVALDLVGEGTPDLITDRGFTIAWLTFIPLWILGVTNLVRADGRLRRAQAAV